MVDDFLIHHAAPHLAGAIDSKHSLEQFWVIANELRISIVRQFHDALDCAAYFLCLYRANNIDRRVVTTSPYCLPELDQSKKHTEDHSQISQQVREQFEVDHGVQLSLSGAVLYILARSARARIPRGRGAGLCVVQ